MDGVAISIIRCQRGVEKKKSRIQILSENVRLV